MYIQILTNKTAQFWGTQGTEGTANLQSAPHGSSNDVT